MRRVSTQVPRFSFHFPVICICLLGKELHEAIAEAVTFYKGLRVSLANRLGGAIRRGDSAAGFRESCHQCLVQLGDLHRYRVLDWAGQRGRADKHPPAMSGVTASIWDEPKRFYHRAIALLPTAGGPHNQLAVVATYCAAEIAKTEARVRACARTPENARASLLAGATPEDALTDCVLNRTRYRLEAVFRYCFALAAERPFETAWPNLLLLFKQFGDDAGAGKGGVPPGGSGVLISANGGQCAERRWKERQAAFILQFLRLHGVAHEARRGFTEAGAAKAVARFSLLGASCLRALDSLLAVNKIDSVLLLKCVAVNTFTVGQLFHRMKTDNNEDGNTLGHWALHFTCEFAATVARRVVVTPSPSWNTKGVKGPVATTDSVDAHALGSVLTTCIWLQRSGAWATDRRATACEAAGNVVSPAAYSLWGDLGALLNRILATYPIPVTKVRGKIGGVHINVKECNGGVYRPLLMEDVALRGFGVLGRRVQNSVATCVDGGALNRWLVDSGRHAERLRRMITFGFEFAADPLSPLCWDAATGTFRQDCREGADVSPFTLDLATNSDENSKGDTSSNGMFDWVEEPPRNINGEEEEVVFGGFALHRS